MAKNIILCSDGTGNTAIKGRGTNVFKLFEAVDLHGHRVDPTLDAQLAYYDDGVGTEGITLLRILGGIAGLGLARNVKQLYRELSRVYDPGDRIFLFGFSRGAFTVRTLAGLIGTCGVVRADTLGSARDLRSAVDVAYDTYRAKYNSLLTDRIGRIAGWPDAKSALATFHREWPGHEVVPIRFIGVWDTVDAVGVPFAIGEIANRVLVQFKFPATDLGPRVERACHALAIDDERVSFEPVLWQVADGDRRITQVWFAGSHSNVGGGYPKQGMSLVALDWMLSEAQEAGLRLQRLDVELFRGHASIDDTLYDSRAGLGVFYRWAPRDIVRYCRKSNPDAAPRIHLSVAERIAHGTADYAPGNLPPNVEVDVTRTGDPASDEVLGERARAVARVIRDAHRNRGHLLDDVRTQIALSTVSYWMFVVSWVLLLFGGSGLLFRIVSPAGALLGAGVGFVAAWALAAVADRQMTDVFSRFWHQHQPTLRAELKRVNAEARAAMHERI